MHLVFVYGSLKKGFHNHHYVEGCKGCEASMEGIELHSGPGFPFCQRGEGVVHGELYEVSDKQLRSIDMLEGHPRFYKREKLYAKVNGDVIEAWVYLSDRAEAYPKIENGMWQGEIE